MVLVNWSLNAIDTLFSKRSTGSGEPSCPDRTFAAGYTMDAWDRWRVVCLAPLSVEDVEDLFIFGTVITGYLLIGVGGYLAYRKIKESVAATKSAKLPEMIESVGRAVGCLIVRVSDLEQRQKKLEIFLKGGRGGRGSD